MDAHHTRVSVGNLGLRENLFVYFNIVCSQSKSKSSLLLLLLSKEPIARKSFDSPRLKFAKLDDFQHAGIDGDVDYQLLSLPNKDFVVESGFFGN